MKITCGFYILHEKVIKRERNVRNWIIFLLKFYAIPFPFQTSKKILWGDLTCTCSTHKKSFPWKAFSSATPLSFFDNLNKLDHPLHTKKNYTKLELICRLAKFSRSIHFSAWKFHDYFEKYKIMDFKSLFTWEFPKKWNIHIQIGRKFIPNWVWALKFKFMCEKLFGSDEFRLCFIQMRLLNSKRWFLGRVIKIQWRSKSIGS